MSLIVILHRQQTLYVELLAILHRPAMDGSSLGVPYILN
jgi:hypothetical protein